MFCFFIIELWVFFISYGYKFLNICTNFLLFSDLSFHFLDAIIWRRRVFNFDEVQCITLLCTFWFVLLVCIFGAIFKKTLILSRENLLLFFFYEFYCFITYIYIYDPFWINFDISCKEEIPFYSFAHEYQVTLEPFVEKIIFSHWIVLAPLSKISWL